MPATPKVPSPPSESNLTEFPLFTFPPPPAKPGNVVLNRFVLYETKTRFFIVGTNAPAGNRFRVLKIDRTTAPDELNITEDEGVYSKSQVDDLLEMIKTGNKSTGGMREIAKFYGIVGFVRFTEGYYITLITKRSPVALIGGHYIFHIDATSTISIHSSTTPTSKLDKNSDEARYLQMYQMVDLSKNFYFSYSYDITRTLQWNMTRNSRVEGRNRMFVWNQYLLENGFTEQMNGIENQWALPIMYGFVDQSKLSILGRNVYVTLIARRSRFFAGARFLKRGANDRGYVANDVETEQIVSEMSTTSFYGSGPTSVNPNHTSFVQHRGSIPLTWTQDGTNMSPKPAIELNVIDPYFTSAALHFDDMFKRYGAPCIVLNLIKAKEKTPRESLLLKEFSDCIEYLNQFLPEDKKIWHIKWDMSRASKSPNENVISVLEIIAERTFSQTGFFHSGYSQDPKSKLKNDKNIIYGSGLQNGVVRTNCIDCLDRTNAAQFIIAKCALGHQLYSLGLIAEPVVPFDCDVVNMLTEMYHDHGDTIALQYGGSHLVNTMETYRKINQWTSHSRDMIESIKRFYSNSFVDAEKQDAMNLFLGNYRVRKGTGAGPALWELPSDYHLHNITDPDYKKVRKSYTKWWTPEALLPQEELARRSFQQEEDHHYGREQFLLHDAKYDDYDGSYDYEDEDEHYDRNSNNHDQQQDDHQDSPNGLSREESAEGLGKYDSTLKQSGREEHHIENLRSEDEAEYTGINMKSPNRVNSMESANSGKSSDSQATLDEIRSPTSAKLPSAQSMSDLHRESIDSSKQGQSQGTESGMRTSRSNPNIPSLGHVVSSSGSTTGNVKSDSDSLAEDNMIDFKERIVAPFSMGKESQGSNALMSSSSSVSSLRRYQQHNLRSSASRSSLAASTVSGKARPGSSAYYTRGEKYIYDGLHACDDGDGDDDEGSGGNHGSWGEYWEEYYRPKVQTSFQRLFAYNMNSTSRYMPPTIKNVAEQSPFEVRQNHSILTQAEINAKTAAQSEKPTMLSWLGLSSSTSKNKGNDSSSGKNSKAGSGYADGSKTLPLSTGRKKGLVYNMDEDAEFQEKGGDRKDGFSHHPRGSRLSISSYSAAEYDEKTGSYRVQNHGQNDKVRLPPHKPRSKKEEYELTKNVWTNLPKFAIHDTSFKPSVSSGETSDKTTEIEGDAKDETTAAAAASSLSVAKPRAKTQLEIVVEKSIEARVEPDQQKEYRRQVYFRSLKLESVPSREAVLLNAHSRAHRGDGPGADNAVSAPVFGAVIQGLNDIHQQYQQRESELYRQSSSKTTSPTSTRPGMNGIKNLQNGGSSVSTTTIASVELNEDEEFLYAASRAGTGTKTKLEISTLRNNKNENNNFRSDVGSPYSAGVSPHSFGLGSTSSSSLTPNSLGKTFGWNNINTRSNIEPYNPPNYLPEPPIMLSPMPVTLRATSPSDLILFSNHVEYPKMTLEKAGKTSLDPTAGETSGTLLRYDFYLQWTLGKRYAVVTAPSGAKRGATAAAAATTAITNGFTSGANGTKTEGERRNSTEHHDKNKQKDGAYQQPPPLLRNGSSTMYSIRDFGHNSDTLSKPEEGAGINTTSVGVGGVGGVGGVPVEMQPHGWKAARA
ncbi:phosphatidylinositol-3,5-bisphosphate 5-phosphatase [Entomortierella beljakovae]|nr:phosphatidylinositol-3,5-bisphosphate 5-phosphatase [Entomortierella beljakovae]